MLIRIRSGKVRFIIPALAFNHIVSMIASHLLKKSNSSVALTPQQFDELGSAIKKARREWGKLAVVEILTSFDEKVIITL